MAIYEVEGTVTVSVYKRVEANSEDEAREIVADLFGGIRVYLGNGSDDKLIGVEEESESISSFADVTWGNVCEVEPDEPYVSAKKKYKCKLCGAIIADTEYADEDDVLYNHIYDEIEEDDLEKLNEMSNEEISEKYFEVVA